MPLLRLDLPATPASVADARRALDALRGEVGRDAWIDLRLLVSEVVTNAVRHNRRGARVVVVADRRPGCVRVEVHDEGNGFSPPARPAPAPGDTSGWGLFLVSQLARRWGAEPGPDAHVWFELATPAAPETAPTAASGTKGGLKIRRRSW